MIGEVRSFFNSVRSMRFIRILMRFIAIHTPPAHILFAIVGGRETKGVICWHCLGTHQVMEPSSKQEWWRSSANISAIKDYAIQQGLLVKATRDPSDETVTNVSVTLTPSLFPRELFDLACSIAADLNSLVDRVSRDEQFLENALQRLFLSVHSMIL